MTEHDGAGRTATDELRRLLDERGVEWKDFDGEPTWTDGDGRMYYARQEFTFNGLTNEVTVYHLTPAQAVEATLGRGECHIRDDKCDRCGALIHRHANMYWEQVGEGMRTVRHRPVNFCPNCGRRVVDGGEV